MPFFSISEKRVCSRLMITRAVSGPADAVTSIYSFSTISSFRCILIIPLSTSFFPSSTISGVLSRSTSNPYSDLPTNTPIAMAMGSPDIPVPGMPTPMAFFSTLALSHISSFSGITVSNSFTFATAKATAIGSVQPMAGVTSCRIRAMISFRSCLVSMEICVFMVHKITNKSECRKQIQSRLWD